MNEYIDNSRARLKVKVRNTTRIRLNSNKTRQIRVLLPTVVLKKLRIALNSCLVIQKDS